MQKKGLAMSDLIDLSILILTNLVWIYLIFFYYEKEYRDFYDKLSVKVIEIFNLRIKDNINYFIIPVIYINIILLNIIENIKICIVYGIGLSIFLLIYIYIKKIKLLGFSKGIKSLCHGNLFPGIIVLPIRSTAVIFKLFVNLVIRFYGIGIIISKLGVLLNKRNYIIVTIIGSIIEVFLSYIYLLIYINYINDIINSF